MSTEFQFEDKTLTMPGTEDSSQYVVLLECGAYRIGARVCEQEKCVALPSGKPVAVVRVRIQATPPAAFSPDTKLPVPFAVRSPAHASATVPGPVLKNALVAALGWCLAQREEVVALTAAAIAPPGAPSESIAKPDAN